MKPPLVHESIRMVDNFLLCVISNSFIKIQKELALSIEFATKAAAIPFAPSPIEGLVMNQQGACLQLDVCSLQDKNAQPGKYIVNIQASKCIVSLRVDSVHTNIMPDNLEGKRELFIENEIEELVNNWELTIETSAVNAPLTTTSNKTSSVVVCQIANRIVGLRPDLIYSFEHSVLIHQRRDSDQFGCIVELENGDLLSGIELRSALGIDNSSSASSKQWAIVIQTEEERFALICDQILGLERHDISLFYHLRNATASSSWLKHPKHGPIEVISPNALARSHARIQHEVDYLLNDNLIKESLSTAKPIEGIGIKFKDFDFVVPSAVIKSVGGLIKLNELKNKPSKHAIPAFDVSKLFPAGNEVDQTMKRLITIDDPKSGQFAMLVHDVYKPRNDIDWTVPRLLPTPLGKLVKAVQIIDGRCQLLLRNEFISELGTLEFNKLKSESFCGWIALG